MKIIFLLNLFLIILVNASQSMIPKYEILNESKLKDIKISYDVRMYLINGRLPNKKEISLVSKDLIGNLIHSGKYQRAFVIIYLPYMKVNEGGYATAHHQKDLKVKMMDYILMFNPKYEKFFK